MLQYRLGLLRHKIVPNPSTNSENGTWAASPCFRAGHAAEESEDDAVVAAPAKTLIAHDAVMEAAAVLVRLHESSAMHEVSDVKRQWSHLSHGPHHHW